MYYHEQGVKIISKLETELFDKAKYKEQYDVEQKETYNNNLLLIDRLIESRNKLDQDGINEYEEKMKEHKIIIEKYENELKNYLQQNPQNEKDIENYENKLNIYQTNRDRFIKHRTKLICQELNINYDNFVIWSSHLDRDTKHTTQEKKQLQEIVNDKLNPYIKEFEIMNTRPKIIHKLTIPTKPSVPKKYNLQDHVYVNEKHGDIYVLFENVKKIKHMFNLYSVNELNILKKEYEKEYIQKYEEKFNKHYDHNRKQYYENITQKYFDDSSFYIDKTIENQYKIIIHNFNYNSYAVCCELKPTLSDDYPVVLRKLKTQIELTKTDKTTFERMHKIYILIIGSFTSKRK